jgi:iron-sulfur cluster insertion protein
MKKYNSHEIEFSKVAFDQIILMLKNDFTLEGLIFRLQISNKGCEGFEYELGFSHTQEVDLFFEYISPLGMKLEFIMEPFTAHYCKNGLIDFYLDVENNEEGFSFKNFNEKEYHGKFYKDLEKLPDYAPEKNMGGHK